MTAETFRPVSPETPRETGLDETMAGGSGSSDPLHIRSIDLPPDPVPEPGADAEGVPPATPPDTVTADQFFAAFRSLIGAPNVLRALQRRPPLKSLQIAPDDEAARQASDALYETCLEVPWLRWMVTYEGKWIKRAVAIGGFGLGLSASVMAELNAERAQTAQPAKAEPTPGDASRRAPKPKSVVVDGKTYDAVL